jgi:hypothetical protein
MFVLKIRKKRLLPRCFCNRETGCKRGGGEPAPWTITWSCVFLDHNLKLSPNRALLKWCFGKVATLHWRLLLRPQKSLIHSMAAGGGFGGI